MKRRTFSPEQKAKIVLAIIDGSKTILETSREHNLSTSLIHKWKDQFLKDSAAAFRTDTSQRSDQEKIRKYEHVIAKLTTQNDFLEKVLTTLK